MKRAVLLVLIVTAVITIVFVWRDSRKGSGKVHDSFSQIEASLQEGLKRLRAASSTDRKAVTDVMIFADALTEVGDVRQKRVAAAAKKEVGQILFGKWSRFCCFQDLCRSSISRLCRYIWGPMQEQSRAEQ